MKKHNKFMEDVKEASSLPAQTCRALGPESEEDIAMYSGAKVVTPMNPELFETGKIDANCENHVGGKNGM